MHSGNQLRDLSVIAPAELLPQQFGNTDYLAIICHEIRTPLNAVVGLANIIASAKYDPKKHQECVGMLNNSSEMLTDLLNDLLDSFKLDDGSVELEHVAFDLAKVLEEAKNIIALKVLEKGLNIQIHIGEGIPTLFMGDPLRIRQIVLNLLGNAVKFTNVGIISLSMTEKAIRNGRSEVCITVADRGIGIAKEKLGRIFDRYKQANASISREYGGTGLGLFISQELAHLMKGNISVKSWQGYGSHFMVTLPLQKAAELLTIG